MKEIAWLKSMNGRKKVGIALEGKEFPEIRQGWDSKWIVGAVYFESDTFKVCLENQPMYETDCLSELVSDISKIVDNSHGKAEYFGTEPYFQMKLEIRKNGVGNINGKIWNVLPESMSFEFNFETDQTCVREFSDDLQSRVRELKVI